MSYFKLPNYREEFFEYKTLTKIHGRPNLEKLLTVFKQLKRNAQRVQTTLGGGQLVYLGLILPQAVYTTIPNATAFKKPTDPGIFAPTTNRRTRQGDAQPLTSAEIATQKSQHDEDVRLYNECQQVELALRNQLIEAIEPIYLKPLRNRNTDMINNPIPEIITFLKDRYGKISDPKLQDMERELLEFVWDPTDQPDTVFNRVDEYVDLCEMINQPINDRKQVQLAYCIFHKTGVYRDSLKDWNKKTTNKDYENFRTFMREEHERLEEVGALDISESSLNQASIIQSINDKHEELTKKLEEQIKINFVEALASYGDLEQSCPTAASFSDSSLTSGSVDEKLGNVTMDSMMGKLLQSFNDLSRKVDELSSKSDSTSTTNRSKANNNNINPKTGRPYKRYCWSCGCCTHWGRFCPNKKKGHQDDASFKDRKGGSSEGCLGS